MYIHLFGVGFGLTYAFIEYGLSGSFIYTRRLAQYK
jgi:hypothetical protein